MTTMHACPHCGGPGISTLRRWSLGPALPATCQSCGRKIGVPWGRSMLTLVPFLLGIGVLMWFRTPLSAAAPVLGMIAGFLLWRDVPLVKR